MTPADEGIRVAVAEDEALIRLDLVEMLEELGYRVVGQAGDGAAAVELARLLRPDVVLMDVAMPGTDGISAAERIVSEGLSAVVLLTAFSQPETIERARVAGVMGYLVKPFTRADLAPAIEVALARWIEARGMSAEIADLQRRLEERRLVERAKGLLQAQEGLTEAAAHAQLRRMAMDAREPLAKAAQRVIDMPRGGL